MASHTYNYRSPIGTLCIETENEAVIGLDLKECGGEEEFSEDPLIKKTIKELDEYFQGKRKKFDIPLNPSGTAFQLSVWNALQEIPYRETRTYGEIASIIGNEKACRAVGGANNKNRIMILIPCHRVIGADGSMIGFGAGIQVKEKLLEIEKQARDLKG